MDPFFMSRGDKNRTPQGYWAGRLIGDLPELAPMRSEWDIAAPRYIKKDPRVRDFFVYVGETRIELATSRTPCVRATNCATPRILNCLTG